MYHTLILIHLKSQMTQMKMQTHHGFHVGLGPGYRPPSPLAHSDNELLDIRHVNTPCLTLGLCAAVKRVAYTYTM